MAGAAKTNAFRRAVRSFGPLAIGAADRPSAVAGSDEWLRLATWARRLSWLSLVWMAAEGAIAIVAGVVAGSIALIGFGLDSAIEGIASVVVIWRFTGSRLLSDAAERRAQRLVAIQFFILAPYIAVQSVRELVGGEPPQVSWVGIALAATSAIGMPLLGGAKRRIGARLGSVATRGEGAQNILCGSLATALLFGLLANALFGWWWLDPIVGLFIVVVALHEGLEAWRGEGCECAEACVAPTAAALRMGASGVEDDCSCERIHHTP